MLTLREKCVLQYIVEHCDDVLKDIEGLSNEEFENNKTIQRSVCMSLFQIGELSKTFSDKFIKSHPGVLWGGIKGMRDIIGHAYGIIKYDDIWNTATEEVEVLKKYCEQILEENK